MAVVFVFSGKTKVVHLFRKTYYFVSHYPELSIGLGLSLGAGEMLSQVGLAKLRAGNVSFKAS